MNNTLILFYILTVAIVAGLAMLIVITAYTIYDSKRAKEMLFEIQLASAQQSAIKDAPSVSTLYSVVNELIGFYGEKAITMSNLKSNSEEELSLLLDDLIVTISTEVELHLSSAFKQAWETWFDKIEESDETGVIPSHLKIYISHTVRKFVVNYIEKIKVQINEQRSIRSNRSDSGKIKNNTAETN